MYTDSFLFLSNFCNKFLNLYRDIHLFFIHIFINICYFYYILFDIILRFFNYVKLDFKSYFIFIFLILLYICVHTLT